MPNDDYPTCAKTHATLRIYPGEIDPHEITERLGIAPSHWQRRGEIAGDAPRQRVAPVHGWFLYSEGHVESRDSARHIDWLLDRLMLHVEAIRSLRDEGCKMDISCYWLSEEGHGGPTIPPAQMKRLAELGIELWFDFYECIDSVVSSVIRSLAERKNEGRATWEDPS